METKQVQHTPGPWVPDPDTCDGETPHWVVTDEQGVTVARCYQQPFDPWTAEANARLIAAAPEMYSLLRAWSNSDPIGTYADKVNAVIAKVEGLEEE